MIAAELVSALERDGRLLLRLKVIPKSSKNEVVGWLEDSKTLKVKITAAPEKNKANAAVCTFLANEFGVGRKNVTILRGAASQIKHVLIER